MERLFDYLATGRCGDEEIRLVAALVEEFPYFFVPRLLCLKRAFDVDRPSFPEKLKQHAIHVPDAKQLYRYLRGLPPFGGGMTERRDVAAVAGERETFEFIREDSRGVLRRSPGVTLPTVYRLEDEFPEEVQEPRAEAQDDPIDLFIRREPVMPRVVPGGRGEEVTDERPRDPDEEFFSETLAKIYLKQRLYDKAITTYTQLSLKYPEKSIYFARLIDKANELKKHNTR
ncbi:MAG: hypothetical protein LBP56_05665 [Odoribacteraceae bacterium]|jgi:hypothetical protein|nr:hypothetical protein [Odoribacteraceae bacterium]